MQPPRPDAAALAEWRELASEATPGPWWSDGCWVWPDHSDREIDVCTAEKQANAAFIAHSSPDRILALLSAYEAERARAERLEKALDGIAGYIETMGMHAYDDATGHYVVSSVWLGEVEDILKRITTNAEVSATSYSRPLPGYVQPAIEEALARGKADAALAPEGAGHDE